MKNEITEQEKLNLADKFKIIDAKKEGWLGYLKLDPTLFAYYFFRNSLGEPMKMFAHQDLILNDYHQLRELNIARGTGKSTVAAVEAIHTAYWKEKSLVLVISSTIPQSTEIIYQIKQLLTDSKFTIWKELMPKGKENKSEVRIKNSGGNTYSRIISVPSTEAGRGYSPDLIICDELASWENQEIFKSVVLGMIHRIDGKRRRVLVLGTPKGKVGPFWENYNSKYWSVYHFDYHVNPYVTEEQMNIIRESMTDLMFRSEYLAEFINPKGSFFSPAEIANAISDTACCGYRNEQNCIVSIDFGKIHDNCVIDIGYIINPEEPKNKQIVRMIDRRVKPLGTNYNLILDEVKAINESIRPSRIIVDATGVGEAPSDILSAAGINIENFKFSLTSKITIMNNLKILFQQKRVQIPNEKDLINQLEIFEYEASETGGIAKPKLHAPKGEHDDEVDALALLCYALTTGDKEIYSNFISSSSPANLKPTGNVIFDKHQALVQQVIRNQTKFLNEMEEL